ncbi:MAG: alanine--tRNA ligase, partial [Coriobacteriales bacterium]|nr:alanine--tRNA ligase [Coriobacteriales bacterium]
GQLLGIEPPFLGDYVSAVISEMGGPYPELRENQRLIERIVHAEEERFNQTLRSGQNYLDAHLAELADEDTPRLSGTAAFELHDRYGFPIDLTVEIAAEQGVEVDREGFETHMAEQRARARAAAKDDAWGTIGGVFSELLSETGPTRFVGYTERQLEARVLALVVQRRDGEDGYQRVESIRDGQKAQVILDVTPFYGEMGGQVGDTGVLESSTAVFTVEDTKVHEKAIYAHIGHIDGVLSVGDTVRASIDTMRRERIERNHTATHLLHHALREILGEHVKQAGSLVAPDRLRFDFTHFEAVTPQQIAEIEQAVNILIMEDGHVSSYETSLDDARENGVTALFGEKYGEKVRVLEAGSASRELCGGTHVRHTAQIGFLKIVNESSVGANLRRIEAITSFDALEYVNRVESELRTVAAALKVRPLETAAKVDAVLGRVVELEGELRQHRLTSAVDDIEALVKGAVDVGYRLIIARSDGHVVEGLRSIWDLIRAQVGDGKVAVVLGGLTPAGSPLLLAAGTPAAVEAGFDAGALIKEIAPFIKGGGGGKPAMAQAGGKDAEGIDAALDRARDVLTGLGQ